MDHLRLALPADVFSDAENIPEHTLKKLYENVLNYGPNADNLLKAADDIFAVQSRYYSYSAYSQDNLQVIREDFESDIDSCLTGVHSINHQSLILLKALTDEKVGLYTQFGMIAWALLYFLMVVHSVDETVLPDLLTRAEDLMLFLQLEVKDYLPAGMVEKVPVF